MNKEYISPKVDLLELSRAFECIAADISGKDGIDLVDADSEFEDWQ